MSYGGLGRDIPWAMDVDSEGNLLVVGAIESKLLKFQGTEFEDLPGVNSDFQADVSVAKIAPDGEVLWFRVFGGEDWERGWDVAVGALDDIYVIGHFESAALENLGCALPGPPLGFDIFVVKLDSSGECVWALSFGGDGLDDGDTVKIAEDGSIYMSGLTLSSEISFGGDNLAAPDVEGTYGGGLWLAKLGPEGEHIWSHRFEAVDPAHPQLGITHMVLEKGGGLHLAGTGLGLDFGDGYLPTFGLIDVFVARFDNSGEHLWSQSFGGSSGSGLTGFEVDSTGDMYLLGSFAGTMDLGGTSVTSAGKTDAFLARMGPEGSVAWSTRLGGAQEDYGLGLGLMQDGHVVAAAFYEGPATDFWGSPLPDTIHLDMYMAKVDPAGGEAWSMAVGGDLQESITAVDVSQSNWVYLIGGFTSTAIDLGGDPLFNADPCDDDCFDCFVAKFEG